MQLYRENTRQRLHLAQLVCLDRVIGDHIEGLKVHATIGDDHPPWLTAQGCDAAAHHLQYNLLIIVVKPARIETLILLMALLHVHGINEGGFSFAYILPCCV